ncbi:MAG: ImmA/IrrE family metallo-endopeptidase [Deltaproteobacteria bacterium]|nr:ImmA/IrrE family metallo-endopeptidase [Deltaproteobacteria bacterium]
MSAETKGRAHPVLEAARRLLDDCAIERAPVDLVRLARHVGIGRIRELDIRLDGQLLEHGDGDYEVILSRNAPHTRRRFTLAHEIGHILVADHENGSMSCGDGPTEELCNRVAAELLMPDRFVHAAITADMDVSGFRRLATQFQCSLEATGWRVLNLGKITGALLVWRQQDGGGLELTAAPRTFGFDLPFDPGHVLEGNLPFVRQLAQRSDGPLTYTHPASGKLYRGDYVHLNKVLLMFFKTAGAAVSNRRRRAAAAPEQRELFGPREVGE